jgi:general secretion pathway protein D
VVAEQRTNSVVVTAIADNLDLVGKVILELDKEVKYENTSFVVTLANSRADLIAQLINQSFSGRNTNSTNRTNTGGTGAQGRTNRANNAGGGAAPGALGRSAPAPITRAAPIPGAPVDLSLEDPSAAFGELATQVAVQQGGGFGGFGQGGFGGFGQGGFGGGNRQNSQSGATTLDAQGRVVNVRDLTGQVTAIPDINTNSVIIVTSPGNRAILQQILDQLDKIPEQVMIETLIVEASLDASSKLGVEWNFSQGKALGALGQKDTKGAGSSSFGVQADTKQPQGLRYTLTGGQYGAFLEALQSDSKFQVLSTPRIFTSNNATAEINISQSLPYVTSQRTDANGNLTFNYSFLDVGIILTVTPRITSNGYVTMDVTQTANDFVRYTDFNAPVVNQREAQTTVSVQDGETIVLGGIIKSSVSTTVNKLPVLGDIPVLGKLFQSTGESKSKTELLVFLTPHVVRDPAEARKLREETQKQMQPSIQKRLNEVLPATSKPDSTDKKEKIETDPLKKPVG